MASTEEYQKDATFASLPRTTRGLPVVINASPDGSKLVYCNGNSVYIRDIQNASQCDIYTEHATLTTVAKYSPSGYYVASGDQSGKVRIWDATQSTHILKAEYPVISGPIRDISWSEDSKRLAVVGEGRERFGHVFLFDTGTSNGNLSGQSRSMTSIDFRPARPYRIVSASEDNTVAIFEGPPFKFKTIFHEHSRFVHCVRYNPSGTIFASAGADGKVVLYEGTDGAKIGELVDPSSKGAAHSGGVFGLCWSVDGNCVATASGDKTVKVWNAANRELMKTYKFGNAVEEQQLSVVWTKSQLFSVSLSGFIHYLDVETDSIAKTLKGHFKPITAFVLSEDKSHVFTADFEGNITRWSLSSGDSERISPNIHKSQVSGMCLTSDGTLVSVGWDDTVVFTKDTLNAIDTVHPNSTKLGSQPRGLSVSSDAQLTVIACHSGVVVFVDQKQSIQHSISYEATCVSLCCDSKHIAVGGQDGKLRIYELAGNSLSEKKVIAHSSAITSVVWCPKGKYLVATDTARKVVPYSLDEDFAVASEKEWTFHTARVNCAAWSDDGRYIATGGLDTNIIIWDMQNSGEHPLIIKGAHSMSPVNGVAWLGPNKILSVGQDSVLKTWVLKV